jgi:hypothetical protein
VQAWEYHPYSQTDPDNYGGLFLNRSGIWTTYEATMAGVVKTFHHNDDSYSVYIQFLGTTEVSSASVTGPDGSGITDEVLYDDGLHIDQGPGDGIFSNFLFTPLIVPNPGDTYIFSYTQNGSVYQENGFVTGRVDEFAMPNSPSGTISTTEPTFDWTPAPNQPGQNFQQLIVFKEGTNGSAGVPAPSNWIWSKYMPITGNSVAYNDDGAANESLMSGESYYWQIATLDEQGNTSWTYQREFIVSE